MRRQVKTTIRVRAVALACSAVLAACGGGGDDESGNQAQSVDFPYPGVRYLATAPAPLNATASSGLAVTFSSNTPAICDVSGGLLVPVSAGECSITANQPGDSTYAAASPTQQLFMVLQRPQEITFASPGFQDINQVPAPLVASADSGLAVTLASATPDVCTVSGTTLTLVSRGQCTIGAFQPGDVNFAAATPESVTFMVGDTPPPVLTILSGYQSITSTNEGGSVFGYAGSNKDGWWCSDPNWCGSAVSADGSSFTFFYRIQPNDPNHPNSEPEIWAYAGFEVVAAGVGSISSTGHTTTGVQVDEQTTLRFSLGQNAEWFSTSNKDVRVVLVLGHFNLKGGNACNVAVSTTFTPTAAETRSYELELGDFRAISEACDLAALDSATELATYPIVKIKFEPAQPNKSVARTPDANPNPPTYPTEITLTGSVTVH